MILPNFGLAINFTAVFRHTSPPWGVSGDRTEISDDSPARSCIPSLPSHCRSEVGSGAACDSHQRNRDDSRRTKVPSDNDGEADAEHPSRADSLGLVRDQCPASGVSNISAALVMEISTGEPWARSIDSSSAGHWCETVSIEQLRARSDSFDRINRRGSMAPDLWLHRPPRDGASSELFTTLSR